MYIVKKLWKESIKNQPIQTQTRSVGSNQHQNSLRMKLEWLITYWYQDLSFCEWMINIIFVDNLWWNLSASISLVYWNLCVYMFNNYLPLGPDSDIFDNTSRLLFSVRKVLGERKFSEFSSYSQTTPSCF